MSTPSVTIVKLLNEKHAATYSGQTQLCASRQGNTVSNNAAFLERLPRDLLFVMRAWALVRSLNRSLGGTSRQRFLIIGDAAARGTAADAGVLGWRRRWRRLRVQLYLRVWEAVAALMTRHLPHTRANLG